MGTSNLACLSACHQGLCDGRRAYRQAVEAFGRPRLLRSDMALEAARVGQDMLDHVGPGSFYPGPSTANQVSGLLADCLSGAVTLEAGQQGG